MSDDPSRPEFVWGDVNGDGRVTTTDWVLAQRMAAGLTAYHPAADFDRDGAISAADAEKVGQLAAGLTIDLPGDLAPDIGPPIGPPITEGPILFGPPIGETLEGFPIHCPPGFPIGDLPGSRCECIRAPCNCPTDRDPVFFPPADPDQAFPPGHLPPEPTPGGDDGQNGDRRGPGLVFWLLVGAGVYLVTKG